MATLADVSDQEYWRTPSAIKLGLTKADALTLTHQEPSDPSPTSHKLTGSSRPSSEPAPRSTIATATPIRPQPAVQINALGVTLTRPRTPRTRVRAPQLQAPTGYTGIYENWNDYAADGTELDATAPRTDFWYFGDSASLASPQRLGDTTAPLNSHVPPRL